MLALTAEGFVPTGKAEWKIRIFVLPSCAFAAQDFLFFLYLLQSSARQKLEQRIVAYQERVSRDAERRDRGMNG